MTNVEALKALYAAMGGTASDVANAVTIVQVLDAISKRFSGTENAVLNADAISNIAAVVGNVPARLQNKTVTPTTSKQTITSGSGYDGLGTVTVNAVTSAIDANIVAGNIKSGVTILGVEGTYSG